MADMIWVMQDDGSYKKVPNTAPKPKNQMQSESKDSTSWSCSKVPYGAFGFAGRFPVLLNGSIIVSPHSSHYLHQFNVIAQKWSKQKIFGENRRDALNFSSMCCSNNNKFLFIKGETCFYVINSNTMKIVKTLDPHYSNDSCRFPGMIVDPTDKLVHIIESKQTLGDNCRNFVKTPIHYTININTLKINRIHSFPSYLVKQDNDLNASGIVFISDENIFIYFHGSVPVLIFHLSSRKWENTEIKIPHDIDHGFGLISSSNNKEIILIAGVDQNGKASNNIYKFDVETRKFKLTNIKAPTKGTVNVVMSNNGDIHLFKKSKHWTMNISVLNEDKHYVDHKQDDVDKKIQNVELKNDESMLVFEDELSSLLKVVKDHKLFIQMQETNVNRMIGTSGHSEELQIAKEEAQKIENELLAGVLNISGISQFLNDIILIENLFIHRYTKQLKDKQEKSRKLHAKYIHVYEKKGKPISNAESFVHLYFGASSHLEKFQKWTEKIKIMCKENNIRLLTGKSSKAVQKKMTRSFYKSFYIYSALHGDKGFKRLTDVLRCSFVFDNFDDLYKCFSLIEQETMNDGGILRCKDKFQPKTVQFGYRDLLININCPQSKKSIICEIQLHHVLFYNLKIESHRVYKLARIFADQYGVNSAYNYADKHNRKIVGDKMYECKTEEIDETVAMKNVLQNWGLHKYLPVLVDEGYDQLEDWKDLNFEDLKAMGFKPGHAKRFIKKAKDL